MGPINIHQNENLLASDQGVAMMRQRIREQIRTLADGNDPLSVADLKKAPIPTYGGDSVINIPKIDEDENAFFSKLAHEFIKIQFDVDGKTEQDRFEIVTNKLKEIQSRENS